jgi:crotonobetainyl-CoA:carnitine CoA-transferase CaiB-like acyl-CoA transferase
LRRDLIYVSITGFGERGPYAGQRAYDPIIRAMSGLTCETLMHGTLRKASFLSFDHR